MDKYAFFNQELFSSWFLRQLVCFRGRGVLQQRRGVSVVAFVVFDVGFPVANFSSRI